MTGPLDFPPPDKRTPPAPAVLASPAPRKVRTGTGPDGGVTRLVERVSTSRLRTTVEELAGLPTRHTFSPHIHRAADLIAATFTAAGYAEVVKLPWIRNGRTADNVVCTKPGTSGGGRIVILCAHYDCRMESLGDSSARAPGADDNASGVAAVLEIARLLHGVDLTETVQFVAFSGEEQGLWGSSAYADALHAAGVDVHRVINMDMVGRPPEDGSVVVERDLGNQVAHNDADSQAFGAVMAQAAADYTDLPVKLGPIYSSDYMPFEAKGYVVIGAYEGEGNPHYHATSDTPETLDYEHYLTPVTRFTLATVLRQWLDTSAGSRVDRASGLAAQM
ncbi:M28 family metallopeptidase [Geodermatophilus sp. URMC 61]|uniref:M28 family metallopeptidase n=1 Tax=Geodermatophilus sp. URMC 61 TaxID=3423411 RepID=UPI00406C64C4